MQIQMDVLLPKMEMQINQLLLQMDMRNATANG